MSTPDTTQAIPEGQLLEDLREVAEQVEGTLSERTYESRGTYGVTTFRRRFGSWNAAKRAAGLTVVESGTIPEEQLLEDLRGVAATVDGSLTERAYESQGSYGATTFRRRFGSWNAAKRAAGLGVAEGGGPEEDALVADIERVATAVDGYVTPQMYADRGTYGLYDLPRDAEFWSDVLDRVGLPIMPLYQKMTPARDDETPRDERASGTSG